MQSNFKITQSQKDQIKPFIENIDEYESKRTLIDLLHELNLVISGELRALLIRKTRQSEGFAFFDAQSKARRKKVGAHKKSDGSDPVKSVGGIYEKAGTKGIASRR